MCCQRSLTEWILHYHNLAVSSTWPSARQASTGEPGNEAATRAMYMCTSCVWPGRFLPIVPICGIDGIDKSPKRVVRAPKTAPSLLLTDPPLPLSAFLSPPGSLRILINTLFAASSGWYCWNHLYTQESLGTSILYDIPQNHAIAQSANNIAARVDLISPLACSQSLLLGWSCTAKFATSSSTSTASVFITNGHSSSNRDTAILYPPWES